MPCLIFALHSLYIGMRANNSKLKIMTTQNSHLIPLSRISAKQLPGHDQMNSVLKDGAGDRLRGVTVLMEAQSYYDNMRRFRADRQRNKRYCYGDQWKDVITTGDGRHITEEQYIREQGSVPLKNNLIRRLVKSVVGIYRSQSKEPTCVARDREEQKLGETMSTLLQYNWQLNRMSEMQARSVEEFLISGAVIHRKWYGWNSAKNKLDCWTEYVQPDNFFIDNNMRDFRGWDVSCIGEIHDVSFNELCGKFAHSPEDWKRLSEIYRAARDLRNITFNCHQFGYYNRREESFLYPTDPSRCRVIEVWRRESKPRYRCIDYLKGEVFKCDPEDFNALVADENNRRLQQAVELGMPESEIPYITSEYFIDNFWYHYDLTPFGDILEEGETPYEHGEHPYVFKFHPFIDGETHSFVADVIDQQRYVNRLITLYDWIMRSSAKGVLLFPVECLPDGVSLNDIADDWARFDSVIAIKTKNATTLPHQVVSNSTNIGISEILNLQIKFFEEISGVQGALQGKPGFSGQSAALYQQQVQNASNSILDILETYSSFTIDAAYKDVKNIQQFYDDKRIANIAGRKSITVDDPDKIRDTEFDLSIVESASSPVFRQLANDFLMQIWQKNQISLEQLLEFGDFPFADELLQQIQSQKEQLQQGQIPQGLSPQLMQQVQQGADMNAVSQAYNGLTGKQAQ